MNFKFKEGPIEISRAKDSNLSSTERRLLLYHYGRDKSNFLHSHTFCHAKLQATCIPNHMEKIKKVKNVTFSGFSDKSCSSQLVRSIGEI